VTYRGFIVCAAVVAAAAVFAWGQKGKEQQPGVVIQTETKLVLVDAVVADKKGSYVTDLTQKDFRVWEDNKEQSIKTFSFEADPASPNNGQKHYLVLFFDTSTMDAGMQVRARQAAAQFLETNAAPNRLMAIVNFTGALQIAQNFTDDADRLKRVVSGVKISAVSPSDTAPGAPQLGKAATDFGARSMILALRSLAKNLGTIPGRKTLVLLTGGFPVLPEQISEVTATLDACNRANVAIYPIDVRGLDSNIPTAAPRAGLGGFPRALAGAGIALFPSTLSNLALFVPQGRGGGGGGAPGGGGAAGGGGGAAGGGGATGGGGGGGVLGGGGGARGGGGVSSPGGGLGGGAPGRGGAGAPTGGAGNPGAGRGGLGNPGSGNPGGLGRGGPAVQPPFGVGPYNQSRDIIPKFPETTSTNQQIMYMLADGTGGFVIQSTNDLLGGLKKIALEQNQYYIIGYTPPDSEEGSCHVLRVKVDRGGTTVRSRTGYCNAKPRDLLSGTPTEKELETRVTGAQPGNVAASIQLPFFYTASNVARVNVAMEIASDKLKFEKQKGKYHAAMNVLGIAYTPDGTVGARFSDTIKIDLTDKKEVENFQEKPFHYENQFDVASGKYTLKVAFNSGGESFGKLEAPLTVEAYDSGEFMLSGLALSKEARKTSSLGTGLDASLLEDKVPLVTGGVQLVPTGSNEFSKAELARKESALVYFEVYEPLLVTPNPQKPTVVAFQMRVLDRKTGEQKVNTGLLQLDLPKEGGSPVITMGARMPVQELGPGSYLLEVTAADSADHSLRRGAEFEIQ
jgi:VWFA-related protein